jgi:large subunit ribosomal protein L25
MTQLSLTAHVRQTKGKGAARKARREDKIPAIFYGRQSQSIMLTVSYAEMERIYRNAATENVILDLRIQKNGGTETKKAMLKELQVDPIKDTYLHADFYEISMDRVIEVDIPVHLVNTPVGVENGGILQHIRRELAISCLPDKLVDFIEVDVAALDVGDALHIEDITFPEGLTPLEDAHLTVVTIASPSVAAEPVEEGVEEAAEEKAAAESESTTAEES